MKFHITAAKRIGFVDASAEKNATLRQASSFAEKADAVDVVAFDLWVLSVEKSTE
jgi:hypothetical protein